MTATKRQPVLPDVPTVGEFVPGYDGQRLVRHRRAEEIRRKTSSTKLNSTINAGLADPALKKKLEDLGGVPMAVTPAEFAKFIANETEKWAKVVKFAGSKVE